jgi:hypothetical protein
MLQAPALVDTLRDMLLSQTRQVGRVVHPNLHPIGPKLLYQRHQQRGARRFGRLARASQCVGQDAQLQRRILPQRLPQRGNELALRLANVQRRQEYAVLGVAYAILSIVSTFCSIRARSFDFSGVP